MSVLVSDVLSYANSLIQGNGTISNSQGILFLNDANADFHLELIKRGVEASQLAESYRDASIAASGQGSTFLFPTDMLALKTISLNYISPPSGATFQNYVIAQLIDVANTQQYASFEFLRINQPIDTPLFDDRGDFFEVFPAFTASMNITQAIRIFYYQTPTLYATTGDTISYPESIDYYILANKIVSIYYSTLMQKDPSDLFQKAYIDRLERLVATLSRGSDQPIVANGLGLTGYEF